MTDITDIIAYQSGLTVKCEIHGDESKAMSFGEHEIMRGSCLSESVARTFGIGHTPQRCVACKTTVKPKDACCYKCGGKDVEAEPIDLRQFRHGSEIYLQPQPELEYELKGFRFAKPEAYKGSESDVGVNLVTAADVPEGTVEFRDPSTGKLVAKIVNLKVDE